MRGWPASGASLEPPLTTRVYESPLKAEPVWHFLLFSYLQT
jgi:hypothetical protein